MVGTLMSAGVPAKEMSRAADMALGVIAGWSKGDKKEISGILDDLKAVAENNETVYADASAAIAKLSADSHAFDVLRAEERMRRDEREAELADRSSAVLEAEQKLAQDRDMVANARARLGEDSIAQGKAFDAREAALAKGEAELTAGQAALAKDQARLATEREAVATDRSHVDRIAARFQSVAADL